MARPTLAQFQYERLLKLITDTAPPAEVPPVATSSAEAAWTEQEEHLCPADKLALVERRMEVLQRTTDINSALVLNELRIYAMALTRLVYGDQGLEFTDALARLAASYMDVRMFVQAIPHLKQVLQRLDRSDVAMTPEVQQQIPFLFLRLGVCLYQSKEAAKAVRALGTAVKRHQQLRGEDHEDNYCFFVALAKAYAANNEFKQAEDHLQMAWAIKEHAMMKNSTKGAFDSEFAQLHIERAKIYQTKAAVVKKVVRKARKAQQSAAEKGTRGKAHDNKDEDGQAAIEDFIDKHQRYVERQLRQAIKAYAKAYELYCGAPEDATDCSLTTANLAFQIGVLEWSLERRPRAGEMLDEAIRIYTVLCPQEDQRLLFLCKAKAMVLLGCMVNEIDGGTTGEAFAEFAVPVPSETLLKDLQRRPSWIEGEPKPGGDAEVASLLLEEIDAVPEDDCFSGENVENPRARRCSEALQILRKLLYTERRVYGEDSPQVSQTYVLIADVEQQRGTAFPKVVAMYERALAVYCAFYGSTHPKTVVLRQKVAAVSKQVPQFPLQ
eukprot:TRINITY_DN17497_c0_g1_i1.p1 TRINITY_DN17497_c0_g1~~TRINITY_DN17497_c0_g1_i1.p1  ORF type:complete len:566 (+),score=104.58 TRINITY_DN17497_c0_g1_i1:45-1700(+)